MYYVYEWYIKETGEVIYVGKGTGRRYKVRKHNRLFNEMIHRFECDSRIVKEFETEKEAFDYEFERISDLWREGQCRCNINVGGTGGSTEWWTEEIREQYSKHNVMKSEFQRKRMSENNPMKNPEIAEKTNSQKRRAVIIGDREYESVAEAIKAYNTCYDTIANWCRKGINANGEKCRFKDSPQVEFNDKRYNKGGARAVVFQDVRYESVKDFAEGTGISEKTAGEWLKNGFSSGGIPCRYEGDTRIITFNKYGQPRKKREMKPVIVNGITYSSCYEAAEAIGIKPKTLRSYLFGARKNPKYICSYGNQQPSQGNVEDSTLEGSTTNG